MNTFKKNQIIITALAIMIAIAGYLNFTNKTEAPVDQSVFKNASEDVSALNATGLVPNDESLINTNVVDDSNEAALDTTDELATTAEGVTEATTPEDVAAVDVVDDEDLLLETADGQSTDASVGEAVFVSSTAFDSILKSKIAREQTRAYSVEILTAVIDNKNLTDEQKVEAASELIDLQDRVEKEAAAEALLEAKGYESVFVLMDKAKVDVVVDLEEITDTDLAQISDIVSRKTNIDPSNIVISKFKAKN